MKHRLLTALLLCSGELLAAPIYTCVVDGQTTYTNTPCPGSKAASLPAPTPRRVDPTSAQPPVAPAPPATATPPALSLESLPTTSPTSSGWFWSSWLLIPAFVFIKRWFRRLRSAFRNPTKR